MPRFKTTADSSRKQKTAPAKKQPHLLLSTSEETGRPSSLFPSEDVQANEENDKENTELDENESTSDDISPQNLPRKMYLLDSTKRAWSAEDRDVFTKFYEMGMTCGSSRPDLIEQCAKEAGKTASQVKVGFDQRVTV